MLRYREFTVSSVDELSWKLIRMVTSPSTSYDTIRYFTEHTGKELHPCITAEIVMKWWRVRESVCPDNTFIITLLSKIRKMYSHWFEDVIGDSRYYDMVKSLGLGYAAVQRYFNNVSKKKKVSGLKQCIQAGNGTPLVLPVKDMRVSDDMEAPAFRYNPAVIPPYSGFSGHRYLVCRCKDNCVVTWKFISFITDTQQEIMNYLEQCVDADLNVHSELNVHSDFNVHSDLNVHSDFNVHSERCALL